MIRQDWSTLKKLMFMKTAAGGQLAQDTAEGNPLSFLTNVAKPLVSLLIPFSPQQEGTGDPSPINIRPISGMSGVNVWSAGKDLFNPALIENGDITSGGAYSGLNGSRLINKTYIRLTPGKYTISNSAGFPCAVYAYTDEDESSYVLSESKTGWNTPPVTFTLTTAKCVRFKWKNLTDTAVAPSALTDLQLEASETATTYEPYAPITHTPVVFPAMGKNQWDEQWEVGTISTTTGESAWADDRIRAKNYCACLPNTTYYVVDQTNGKNIRLFYYDQNKAFIGDSGWKDGEVTTPAGAYFFRFIVAASYGTTYGNNIAINYPATATSYEPFTNTVYGGTLDVVSGVLTVTHKLVKISSLSWAYQANWNGRFRGSANDKDGVQATVTANVFCDSYKSELGTNSNDNIVCGYGKGIGGLIYIKDSSFGEDAEAFVETMGEHYICYPVVNPQTVTLTPTQLTALIGNNTIWSDADGQMTAIYLKKG